MSKFKNFIEFREQFDKRSIAEHIFLHCVGQMVKEKSKKVDLDKLRGEGFDLKLSINGELFEFTEVMTRIDDYFTKIENQAKEISKYEIEKLFKEKVTNKLYTIIDNLDYVDKVIKECIL